MHKSTRQNWLTRVTWLALASLTIFVSGIAGFAEDAPAEKATTKEDNPYVPRDDLSTLELFELIERMKGLSKSIQSRPGFGDAIVICADRILAKQPDETMRAYACRAKMDGYQRSATWGGKEAQKQLVALATECQKDKDTQVARWAAFYLLEDKVLAADSLKPEELPALLVDVQKFITDERLDDRHVRLASATVKLINRLPSDDDAEKAYKEFGSLFAASTDDELHRYGNMIEGGVAKKAVDLTGQLIPLAGTLTNGTPFDVANWKGKVVLVDFWATWCGPCRALLPEIKAIHEHFHGDGFEVIGINLDEDKETLEEFLKENELPWQNVFDRAAADDGLAKKYNIVGIPTTFLLDKQGKLVATNLHGEALAAKIADLLEAK